MCASHDREEFQGAVNEIHDWDHINKLSHGSAPEALWLWPLLLSRTGSTAGSEPNPCSSGERNGVTHRGHNGTGYSDNIKLLLSQGEFLLQDLLFPMEYLCADIRPLVCH